MRKAFLSCLPSARPLGERTLNRRLSISAPLRDMPPPHLAHIIPPIFGYGKGVAIRINYAGGGVSRVSRGKCEMCQWHILYLKCGTQKHRLYAVRLRRLSSLLFASVYGKIEAIKKK